MFHQLSQLVYPWIPFIETKATETCHAKQTNRKKQNKAKHNSCEMHSLAFLWSPLVWDSSLPLTDILESVGSFCFDAVSLIWGLLVMIFWIHIMHFWQEHYRCDVLCFSVSCQEADDVICLIIGDVNLDHLRWSFWFLHYSHYFSFVSNIFWGNTWRLCKSPIIPWICTC